MLKLLTVWITTDCEKLLEMGIPDCLTCLLRNLYCGSRSNRRGATDRFKIGKEVQQGCVLSLCLFNLHAVSVQFSYSVVSNSLWPQGSTPGFPVHHQLLELAQTHVHRVGDAIQPSHPLSSPSSSFFQSFPAAGSFLMSQFFTSSGQSIGASASVFPMNTQDWFPLGLTGLISLQSKDERGEWKSWLETQH